MRIPMLIALIAVAIPSLVGATLDPIPGPTDFLRTQFSGEDEATSRTIQQWSDDLVWNSGLGIVGSRVDAGSFVESKAMLVWPGARPQDQFRIEVSLDFRTQPPDGRLLVRGSIDATVWTPWRELVPCEGNCLKLWSGTTNAQGVYTVVEAGRKGFPTEDSRTWSGRLVSHDPGTPYHMELRPFRQARRCDSLRTVEIAEEDFPIEGMRWVQFRWEATEPAEPAAKFRLAGFELKGWAFYSGITP